MEIELVQDVANKIGLFDILAYTMEDLAHSIDRQRWNLEDLTVRGNGGDPRGDTWPNVVKPARLLHHSVDLLGICPLRIEDGLRIVEDYKHLPRG